MMKTVGVTRAAELLGVHEQTIRGWIYDGKLEAHKNESGRWEIPMKTIEEILAEKVKRSEQALDMASGIEAIAKNHAEDLGRIEAMVVAGCKDVVAAGEEALKMLENGRASEIAKSERFNELTYRINKLQELMTYRQFLHALTDYLNGIRQRTAELINEHDNAMGAHVELLKERREQMKERVKK